MKTTKKIQTKHFSTDFEGNAISRVRTYDPKNLKFEEETDKEMVEYHKIYLIINTKINLNGIYLSPVLAIHDVSDILKKHFYNDEQSILTADIQIKLKFPELEKELIIEDEECTIFVVPCEYNMCLIEENEKEVHLVIRNPKNTIRTFSLIH